MFIDEYGNIPASDQIMLVCRVSVEFAFLIYRRDATYQLPRRVVFRDINSLLYLSDYAFADESISEVNDRIEVCFLHLLSLTISLSETLGICGCFSSI
jgi:hypothetical protein